MNILKSSPSLTRVAMVLFSSCASSVKITSSPPGADVYADGFYTHALHWAAVSKNQSIDQVVAEIRAALKC